VINSSETKARLFLKKNYPLAYIRKIPDFKQTGLSSGLGLPDYLVICQGVTTWFEVKAVKSSSLFPFSAVSESQYIVFSKMVLAGAVIWVLVYMDGSLEKFLFSKLLEKRLSSPSSTSVSVELLH
jgi:penicillin-binding protein-related factor A (putative recombinase)